MKAWRTLRMGPLSCWRYNQIRGFVQPHRRGAIVRLFGDAVLLREKMEKLQDVYPWTSPTLICNGPMAGFAGPRLAAAVTQAGGIGFIGTVNNMSETEQHLEEAKSLLSASGHFPQKHGVLPVGVGFLLFIAKLDECVDVVMKHKPAIVWLFGAKKLPDYATWTREMRMASPGSKIWVQVGSVAAAVEVVKTSQPDVLNVQGIDAGGHGFEKGAGVISLLPEVADALAKEFPSGKIPLMAAGGIVDGRGVAAAYALGASGVVMGTRFLASKEVMVPHKKCQDAIIATKDGGQNTVRAKVFDELRGPNLWPEVYDGRSIVTESYKDHKEGKDVEHLRKLLAEAAKGEGKGFGDGNVAGRATVWAGTGVGLVNEVRTASEIVNEVRKDARMAMDRCQSVIS